jgi:small subunit ribosomal protein S20
MPNIVSAKKRLRQALRRTAQNRSRTSRTRTFVRKLEEAIASGDKEAALKALAEAEPILVRSAQKGVLHANTARRKVSRLAHRVNAMGA